MTQTLIMCGTMIVGALLYILVWLAWDKYITQTRLEQNQKAWDEYSNGMTDNEKWGAMNCFAKNREQKTVGSFTISLECKGRK